MLGTIATIVTRFAVAGVARVRLAARQLKNAFRNLDSSVSGAQRRIASMTTGAIRGIGNLGKSISGLAVNKFTVIGGGLAGIATLAMKAAGPLGTLAAGLGALGGAGLAGVLTFKDTKGIQQASKALAITPELASNWQVLADQVGLTLDDVVGPMQALSKSVYDSIDPTSDAAKMWKTLGISTKDAGGRLKNSSNLMFELSDRLKNMQPMTRSIVLTEIFGEADALKLGELFERLGKDRDKLIKEYEGRKRDKLLVSQEQLDALRDFRVGLSDIILVVKAFARELFLTFAPTFKQFMTAFDTTWRNPEKRAKAIQRFFVEPFWRAFQLVRDIFRVFAGFDFVTEIFGGTDNSPVKNTWLYDLQWWLRTIWDTIVGLTYIGQGLVRALVDIGRYVDRIVEGATGFSISSWFDKAAASDFRAFGRDIRSVLDDLFAAPIDASAMETSVGRSLAGVAAIVQRRLGPIVDQFSSAAIRSAILVFGSLGSAIGDAMAEVDGAMGAGKGISGIESVFGRLIYLAGGAAKWIANLATNFEQVVLLGNAPNEGFVWLEDLTNWFREADIPGKIDGIIRAIPELVSSFEYAFGVLAPFWNALDGLSRALTGVGAGANLLVLAFGSLFVKPIALAFAALDGLFTLLSRGRGLLLAFKGWLVGSTVGGWLLAGAQALGTAAAAFTVVYWGLQNLQKALTGIRDWLSSFGTWTQPVVDALDWILSRIEAITTKMAGLIRSVPVVGEMIAGKDPALVAPGESSAPSIPNPFSWVAGQIADGFSSLVNGFEGPENAGLPDLIAPDPSKASFTQQTLDAEKGRADAAAAAAAAQAALQAQPPAETKTPITLVLQGETIDVEAGQDAADRLLRSNQFSISGR